MIRLFTTKLLNKIFTKQITARSILLGIVLFTLLFFSVAELRQHVPLEIKWPLDILWNILGFGLVMIMLVVLFTLPPLLCALSLSPSILLAKILKPKKQSQTVLATILVIVVTLINFLIIGLLYEYYYIATIDEAYGRGSMNLLFILFGFPTLCAVLIWNTVQVAKHFKK